MQRGPDPLRYAHRSTSKRNGGVAGSALLYIKGGIAWTQESLNVHCTASGNCLVPVVAFNVSANETRQVWTLGTGVQYAFGAHWFGKLEYDFYDFGGGTIRFPAGNT